ncbi:MAG TPA: patatin-like phospholipase family protein [Planctomycetota bacterium]|nr:patatin-like phospholipase family protein [Planctomycetota bacterium]
MNANGTATEHGRRRYLAQPRDARQGRALCMSGGGYRAALFHLGALRRLNELGLLSTIDTFTSVSGGSIMAAQLATFLSRAKREAGKPVEGFEEEVADPMRDFAAKDVRTAAALARLKPRNWLTPGAQSEALAAAYEPGPAPGKLSALPDTPRFVFLASDMRFRDQWSFDTGLRRVGSPSAGFADLGEWTLAQAVAASSCVPGAFSVVHARQQPSELAGGSYREPDRDRLVADIDLSDGGMYDNLGLEPVWRDHSIVLVSDAAPSFKPDPDVGWLWSALRQGVILLEQATEVRKRWLVSDFIRGELSGAYWGIASKPSSYDHEPPPTAYSPELIRDFIAPIRIDLDVFSPGETAVLENHGYLMAEIALHQHGRVLVDADWNEAEVPHPHWMDEQRARRALADSDKTRIFFRPRINP